jgi:polyphenol oxidase
MQRFEKNGIEWLEFDLLSDIPRLKHAVFLRHGGVSQGAFKSLNVSFDVEDDPTYVKENLQRIENIFWEKGSSHKMTWAKQCHEATITEVNLESPQEIEACDALMSSTPRCSLLIKHADCQAAIFYDPHHHVVANVHAGWRGNVIHIYEKTIQKMQGRYGSKPSELLVCISPSLGPDEAEFIHYKYEFPEEFWQFQVKPNYFDLWAISEMQLQQAGILPHHIEIAKLSTYSNAYDFFSYRRDKRTGRHGTVVALL